VRIRKDLIMKSNNLKDRPKSSDFEIAMLSRVAQLIILHYDQGFESFERGLRKKAKISEEFLRSKTIGNKLYWAGYLDAIKEILGDVTLGGDC